MDSQDRATSYCVNGFFVASDAGVLHFDERLYHSRVTLDEGFELREGHFAITINIHSAHLLSIWLYFLIDLRN